MLFEFICETVFTIFDHFLVQTSEDTHKTMTGDDVLVISKYRPSALMCSLSASSLSLLKIKNIVINQ